MIVIVLGFLLSIPLTLPAAESNPGQRNDADLLLAEDPPKDGKDNLDLLLDEDDDLLSEEPTAKDDNASMVPANAGMMAHAQLLRENQFPSAVQCRTCHVEHYREWAGSQHAYAQLSPVFNSMQATITKLTSGSNGDFCIRCHTIPGMESGEPLFTAAEKRHPVSREGVTCIVCHRVGVAYGKMTARMAINKGSIHDPIFGPSGNEEVSRVIQDEQYKVAPKPGQPGRSIHSQARHFYYLEKPGFCGSCHDVNLPTGFRLEEAFSQYKNSPAAKRGESCQDCHMGKVPGHASGYRHAPAAFIGDQPTRVRKRTSHMWVGPDYSIVHPGIFPHNPKATELATIAEWIVFDHKAGWGTDDFEDHVTDETAFPERWAFADDRYEAREIIDDQLAHLEEINEERLVLLRRGYQFGDLKIRKVTKRGLDFSIEVKNGTDGHNVPTGFDVERLVFLEVKVTDAQGTVVFKSGDRDPNGDVRDLHSLYVRHGEVPLDKYLFSLQSKFLVRNLHGAEREQVLAINESIDPLPFIRPSPFANILTGRPSDVRKQNMAIPPGASRWGRYKVSRKAMTGHGPYRLQAKLIAQMVPVNLIHEISGVGFDFNMSSRDVAREIVDKALILYEIDTLLQEEGTRPLLPSIVVPQTETKHQPPSTSEVAIR